MNERKRYNLHNHTYYSDGKLSPTKVVAFNKKRGYNVIAITDHGSVDGIEEAIEAGKRLGVTVIPGVELETKNFELLGLFIDYKNQGLRNFLSQLKQYKEAALKQTIRYLNAKGVPVTPAELKGFARSNAIFEETIVDFLIRMRKKQVASKRAAIKLVKAAQLKGIKKKFPKEIHSTSVKTAARLISAAGGVPVLAHPSAYGTRSNLATLPFLAWFLKTRGIKGMETQTARQGRRKAEYLAILAKLFRMQQTGGMDFHRGSSKEWQLWALHKNRPAVEKFLKKNLPKLRK